MFALKQQATEKAQTEGTGQRNFDFSLYILMRQILCSKLYKDTTKGMTEEYSHCRQGSNLRA